MFGSAETCIQFDDSLWRLFTFNSDDKDKVRKGAAAILRDIYDSFININYSHLNDQLNEIDTVADTICDEANGGSTIFII